MTALKALLLSDVRPGYYRLAEGIIAAISRVRVVETTRLEVRRRVFIPARMVSYLINRGFSQSLVLAVVYGLDARNLPPCDVVVSAGGNTLGANIAMSRFLVASNIFYGSLRRFKAADFSLVLTSYSSQVRAPNQFMSLKPSAMDPEMFSKPGENAAAGLRLQQGPRIAGLILGGNSGTVRFAAYDWQRLFSFMFDCHQRWGTVWVVSNSARTPETVSRELAKRFCEPDNSIIHRFIDVRDPNAASLEALLSQSEIVVCTADSSSMLSETVWARKPVISLAPKNFDLPTNERGYRDWLAAHGWTIEMPISALEPDVFLKTLATLHPLNNNPLDRLARELRQRLPSLLSQAYKPG